MDQEHLHRLLEQLHTELRAAKPVGEENRTALERLARDIRSVLDRRPAPAGTEPYRAMRPRLEDAVRALEASHPQVSKAIERVVDTLALYNL
ncbi:MAG TPA: DUF4404 family protein [Gemmatimonadales bacterium]|nr:DUF4404 family protein [Gemmatimonadales bacterium]